jgi:hypothetical protein
MKPAKHYHLHGESGQAIIATALCVACLVGFVGFAVDLGQLLRAKTNLQKVADAAALAGAAEYVSGGLSRATLAAQASALQNGIDCTATGITCPVSIGTTAHPQAVSVYISQRQSTYLAGVFGYPTITVGARAAAGIISGQVCFYALDTTATAPPPNGNYGIVVNGGGSGSPNPYPPPATIYGIYAPQCSVYDNANLNLNGIKTLITAASIGIAGPSTNGSTSPTPVYNLIPVSDPLAGYWKLPALTPTLGNLNKTSGSVIPGVYNNFNVSGAVTLQPGLYVIQGNLDLNITTPANGVTFYVDSAHGGTLACNGGNCGFSGNLTAPSLGTSTTGSCSFNSGCNGLLLWDPETTTHPKTASIGCTTCSVSLTGIIYAPTATLTLNGNGLVTLNTDIVAGAYVLNGDFQVGNYSANAGPASPFNSAALLE